MSKNKVVSISDAMKDIQSGMTIMIPGFVNCGVPRNAHSGDCR